MRVVITKYTVNAPETALSIVAAAQVAASVAGRLDCSRRVLKNDPRWKRAAIPLAPPLTIHPTAGVPLYAPPVNLPPVPLRYVEAPFGDEAADNEACVAWGVTATRGA